MSLSTLLFSSVGLRADIPQDLRPLGMGLGGFTYYSGSPFANSMLSGADWLEFSSGGWGSGIYLWETNGNLNPQFDANGYPLYLKPGTSLRLLVWPYGVGNSNNPPTWPERSSQGIGKWVLTWEGEGDLRLNGGGATYLTGESSGSAQGSLTDGRRVYQMGPVNTLGPGHLTVLSVNPNNPITDIKIWMPDPSDPTNKSLENSGQFWHPTFLEQMSSEDFQYLRFMDWGATNQSPQQDWSDRRRPDHATQRGVLHRRSPAPGVGNFAGNRVTGIAYEYMIDLANTLEMDMWVCVPHMATDDYVTKLAQLILYGSDGFNPYTEPQANPVYPPLDPNLRVWVEYSNEVWSNGNSFPQGNWAEAQGQAQGLSPNAKARFNARRYSQIWSLFQETFGGSERIVRVAAIWAGSDNYTVPFFEELAAYGPTLTPAVSTDAVAPTTYFGNGIQDWAYEQANLNRGTDRQWFHTEEDFVHNTSTGAERPVSVPLSDPYWENSDRLIEQHEATFLEWKKRIFSGSRAAGGGPDSTGINGGFQENLLSHITSIFGQRLAIAAYEGGPSLYTDYYDSGDVRDDGVTNYMVTLNRNPAFREVYKVQLNMAKAKGLDTHSLFVDVSLWGKYGQWGHLEYPGQPLEEAIKWSAASEWAEDMAHIRQVDNPLGARPEFVTPAELPFANYRTPYQAEIVVTGGDVGLDGLDISVVGSVLSEGMTIAPVPGDPHRLRISGTPQEGGWNYVYLRAVDDDGDAAWRVYNLYIAGGAGTLVEADISGGFDGVSDLPWTAAHYVGSNIEYSGIDIGAPFVRPGGTAIGTDGRGVRIYDDPEGIRFSVDQGAASQNDSTLASAILDDEYFKVTVTPKPGVSLDLREAEFRLTWLRRDYHAPRRFDVFTSVEGFTDGNQIYTLANMPNSGAVTEHVFRLPDSEAYADLTAPVEFRVYLYGSQYAHQAKLLGFKLSQDPARVTESDAYADWAGAIEWGGADASAGADPFNHGITNLMAFALGLDPLQPPSAGTLPNMSVADEIEGRWLDLTYRRSLLAGDLNFEVLTSTDLSNWAALVPNGVDVIEEIVDPDPDGNGSVQLMRTKVRSDDEDARFLRLKVTQ